MFGSKKADAAQPPATPEEPERPTVGKGAPTPRRNNQQAQNKRPLVPTDRKVAKAQAREQRMAAQERMRIANETGDERYLSARDKGPQKRFARDFVDARWMVGEFLMIVILVFLVVAFTMTKNVQIQAYITFGLWIVLGITIIDSFIMSRQLKKRLVTKFGSQDRGVLWYACMRGLQFRKLRLPKPQVSRGAKVE
ncbi:hypothetical protein GCM10009596_13090 [Arthrobacter rhombi]|uniref:DUF3043 domain-containing protein n=1 Tax=Arthrobacter rhombi TaxID=71253 RepID=UPI0031D0656E